MAWECLINKKWGTQKMMSICQKKKSTGTSVNELGLVKTKRQSDNLSIETPMDKKESVKFILINMCTYINK